MVEIAILCFCALMLAAAASDIATMTIPNWVSIALAVIFPAAAFAAGAAPMAVGLQIAYGVAALVVVFILFQLNIMGGGDAKLIAAACLWLGPAATPNFIVWTTIAGGVLAMVALAARRIAQPSPSGPAFMNRLLSPNRGIPYGVAICAGALAALPNTWIARGLF